MSRNISACFSKKTDDWRTPSNLYNAFIDNGFIDCFPFHSTYDELNNIYFQKRLFVNPPFSKLNAVSFWIEKNVSSNIIALLIPSRTDTKYFHRLLKFNPSIYFIEGRLHYNDSNSAPFPSLLLLFNNSDLFSSYYSISLEGLINLLYKQAI